MGAIREHISSLKDLTGAGGASTLDSSLKVQVEPKDAEISPPSPAAVTIASTTSPASTSSTARTSSPAGALTKVSDADSSSPASGSWGEVLSLKHFQDALRSIRPSVKPQDVAFFGPRKHIRTVLLLLSKTLVCTCCF